MANPNETVPGGKYINTDGVWVNADGKFIDERGNVVDQPVKANQPKPNSAPVEPPEKPAEKK